MRFAINEAVKLALRILNRGELRRGAYVSNSSLYPSNILVLQDKKNDDYIETILQLLLRCDENTEKFTEQHLDWQLRQLYRVLNAACSSIHSTNGHKELTRLRADIENTEQIQAWLAMLAKQRQEIICVGHGDGYIEYGHVTNYSGCEIYCYSPTGAFIEYQLATVIENGLFDVNKVHVEDEKRKFKFIPDAYPYPKRHSNQSLETLPDFVLSSDDVFKSRIIEMHTSRVLLEPTGPFKLSEIVKCFPHSKIHWAACTVVRSLLDDEWLLTPNANYVVYSSALQNHFAHESHYRKLRRTTVKFKYDANFTLFAADRKGTLNPGVEEELKRKLPRLQN